jgi:hypothetical protein
MDRIGDSIADIGHTRAIPLNWPFRRLVCTNSVCRVRILDSDIPQSADSSVLNQN